MRLINRQFANAHGKVCQPISYERLLATRGEAREKMQAFLIDLKRTIGFRGMDIGSSKTEERVEQKIYEDGLNGYQGDKSRVLDLERCKGIIDTPAEVQHCKAILRDNFSDLMLRHNARFADINDLFADPKNKTGYRCINSKIALPVGHNEEHIVEVQIVASQLEELYDKTHKFLDIGRKIGKEARHRELTKEERRIMAYADAACRYHNGIAARDAGYDMLLDPQKYAKHAMTPTKQNNYENMILALEMLRAENII